MHYPNLTYLFPSTKSTNLPTFVIKHSATVNLANIFDGFKKANIKHRQKLTKEFFSWKKTFLPHPFKVTFPNQLICSENQLNAFYMMVHSP